MLAAVVFLSSSVLTVLMFRAMMDALSCSCRRTKLIDWVICIASHGKQHLSNERVIIRKRERERDNYTKRTH